MKRGYNKVVDGKKKCSACECTKDVEDFYPTTRTGYPSSKCKECTKQDVNKYRTENATKKAETARAYNLKKNYGITVEQYEEMLSNQNHRCLICDKHEDEVKTRLAVDHNHVTGEIRGLLCTYCNHRIVGRHRDGNLLRKIADYIEQGTGLFVPPKVRKKRKRKG